MMKQEENWLDLTPQGNEKLMKWLNDNDGSRGLDGMSIYEDIKFHVQTLDTPQGTWFKFENLLIHDHWLENQLI
jgi:hypothetical protein